MWYETFGHFPLYLPLVLFPTICISTKLQKICHFGGIIEMALSQTVRYVTEKIESNNGSGPVETIAGVFTPTRYQLRSCQ